jgi:hypothetical protein
MLVQFTLSLACFFNLETEATDVACVHSQAFKSVQKICESFS